VRIFCVLKENITADVLSEALVPTIGFFLVTDTEVRYPDVGVYFTEGTCWRLSAIIFPFKSYSLNSKFPVSFVLGGLISPAILKVRFSCLILSKILI
jgi:hypothetical protein